MQCFRPFHTAERTTEGIEATHVMRKGQVKRLDGRDAVGQVKFVESLFGVAAGPWFNSWPSSSQINFSQRHPPLADLIVLVPFELHSFPATPESQLFHTELP